MTGILSGDVTITSYPEGSLIYIDNILIKDEKGEPLKTPIRLTMIEGLHNVRLTLEGYCDAFDAVEVLPNGYAELHETFYIC